MNISKNTVVSLAYTLKDDEGNILDKADANEPFIYLHGHGGIIPGLENAVEGKSVDDAFTIAVSPEEAYGERNEGLLQEVSKEMFGDIDPSELKEGHQFHAETDQGMQIITLHKVGEDTVTIDGNHPMAGLKLHFELSVLDIREATEEEISHGHIHADGGSCGHHH